jgi:hypothetical protein
VSAHFPNQRDRDNAAAGAGLIVLFVLFGLLTLVFLAGCVVGRVTA